MEKKFNKKKVISNQSYDNYWKFTLEYTNINGDKFRGTLGIILKHIDENYEVLKNKNKNDKELKSIYNELQNKVYYVYPKRDMASVRKSINQFVKLGFIEPFLRDYHKSAKKFLRVDNNEKRKIVFSEVFYDNANFNSAVTVNNRDNKQVNFLIKTLMNHPSKQLNKNDLIALMNTDVRNESKGYLYKYELEQRYRLATLNDFKSKKYNQLNYLFRIIEYVPGIIVDKSNELIYFMDDAPTILEDSIDARRDQYRHYLLRKELKQESVEKYGKVVCYFTKRELKGLVASHIYRSEDAIKNFDIEAAYDTKNTILLEQNVDAYFDKYDLTFDKSGNPYFGNSITKDFREVYEGNKLDEKILDENRLEYLEIHNSKFEQKNE